MRKAVVVDTPGVKLRVEGERLVFFSSGRREEMPLDQIECLVVCEGTSVTTDLLSRAAARGIAVTVTTLRGEPTALVLPATYGGTAKTRREQLRAYDDDRGVELAKAFARAAIESKAVMLSRLARNREGDVKLRLMDAASRVREHLRELPGISGHLDDVRSTIMGVEGRAAEEYFRSLGLVVPPEYGYRGVRTRRPPRDPFNAAISFANSFVYSEAFRAAVMAGLDPFSGYLHADRSGRTSVSLDLAEEFMVYASHRSVIPLFTKRVLDSSGDFTRKGGGVYLRGRGRKLVVERVLEALESRVDYRGESWRLKDVILGQARAIAAYVRGDSPSYDPWRWRG